MTNPELNVCERRARSEDNWCQHKEDNVNCPDMDEQPTTVITVLTWTDNDTGEIIPFGDIAVGPCPRCTDFGERCSRRGVCAPTEDVLLAIAKEKTNE